MSIGLKQGTVQIVEYQPEWKVEFTKERKNLQKVLGKLALEIHHIGSTSVPELDAKPIIDILVVSNSLKRDVFDKRLNSIGYIFRANPQRKGRLFYAKGPEERRTHYLHIAEKDTFQAKIQLMFRDYLRTHKQARVDYAKYKNQLAKQYPEDRMEYTAQKSTFIGKILFKLLSQEMD